LDHAIQIEINVFSAIDIFSCTTAFMLGLLFLTSQSDNKRANLFLGLSLWSLAGEVLSVLMESVEAGNSFIVQTSLFTIPFLFFYINNTVKNANNPWLFLLLLPGLLFNLLPWVSEWVEYFEYLFNITLLCAILFVLKRHKERVNNFYSELENKTLKWMRVIVFIFLGFHLLWIIEDLIAIQHERVIEYFADASGLLTFFMIFWIGHNGFSQSEIFRQKLFAFQVDERQSAVLHTESTITHDSEIYSKLCQYIREEELFANPKLNLRILSQSFKVNEKEVSRLINQHSQGNFYQFINQFRVEAFKTLLHSDKARQLSLLGLAEEAGFNSKSTFYTAFKTFEGMTPKQYELSVKKSE